jgi:hypothetical protein
MHENDAAKMFDLAAIKLRGRNTKLNFPYEEYLDGEGQVSSRGDTRLCNQCGHS